MKRKDTIFASHSESKIYESLKRQWKDYDIYSSLPFLNIIEIGETDIKEGRINQKEWEFLLKTSVDFTLCERPSHRPLLSIDFDGLGHGFSHFGTFPDAPQYVETFPTKDRYRKLKFDLKLRLCHQLAYVYIIVSYKEAYPFNAELDLTILDGIIGRLLSGKRLQELLIERKSQLETDQAEKEYHQLKKAYEKAGTKYTFRDYIQDWFVGLEVEADFESDPIFKEAANLKGELRAKGVLKGEKWTSLEEPPAPGRTDFKALAASTRMGCEVNFETPIGEIKERVFVRNIGDWLMSSIIAGNIAELLALRKIMKQFNVRQLP